jgi:hypothetical protein
VACHRAAFFQFVLTCIGNAPIGHGRDGNKNILLVLCQAFQHGIMHLQRGLYVDAAHAMRRFESGRT